MSIRLSDVGVMQLLQSDLPLNKARKEFSHGSARIEQAQQQRVGLSPVELRRMEFEVVEKIIAAYNGA